jgi:hypothetical protein
MKRISTIEPSIFATAALILTIACVLLIFVDRHLTSRPSYSEVELYFALPDSAHVPLKGNESVLIPFYIVNESGADASYDYEMGTLDTDEVLRVIARGSIAVGRGDREKVIERVERGTVSPRTVVVTVLHPKREIRFQIDK